MNPEYCPFCGEKKLEALEPTELTVDDIIWTIYHYECQFCTNVFDIINPEGEIAWDDLIDPEDEIMLEDKNDEEGYH